MRTKHNNLLLWLKSATDTQVSRTGTSRGYLRLIAYGHKTASAEIASRTEAATAGAATRQGLRPHDWQHIWPELMPASGKAKSAFLASLTLAPLDRRATSK
jgi:DNA-binding transcriptional regulator YdaS (Cro superfamily)